MNGNTFTTLHQASLSELSKKERVQKYGEVFTPDWMVKKMCDELPQEAWELDKTFLEPSCGDGVFVVEILRRKFANCKAKADYRTALNSVWAMELQEQNVKATIENVTELCKRYFKPTKDDLETISNHVIQCDSLKVMKLLSWWNQDKGK